MKPSHHHARRLPLAAALVLLAILAPAAAGSEPTPIPIPAELQSGQGRYELQKNPAVVARGAPAARVARYFADLVQRTHGLTLQATASEHGAGVTYTLDPTAASGDGGYVLDVDDDGARILARDERGLFYGAITLWQLLDADGRLPAVHIEDAPRFGWRGLMLDSARHMQSVDEIKHLLDAMALHKLNVFHWHLTDDQGWRIEIKRYPRLTEVGGCRIPAGDAGIDPGTGRTRAYCGHYTQAQIREIVAYAAERHITVMPEIDMPGHAQAAVAAYPELGAVAGETAVSNEWGIHTYLFNAEEGTFGFLENVLAEVLELFPSTYIHVGGDEAVKDQWQASARVQARMRALGVADETQLQAHFIARIERFLSSHGRKLIGWDEILEGRLPADATVMSWRGIEGGIEAARGGHDVVMSPSSHLYLDYLQTDSPNEPPGRPATIPLRQVYAFEPVPEALDATQARHVLGVQANVWTEHMRDYGRVQHAVFPRIAALAEIGWSPADRRDYDGFLARLPAQLRRYRALGIAYAQTPFEVRMAVEAADRGAGTATVALSNALGYDDIRYTIDGGDPTAESPSYEAPLALALPAEVRARVFVDGEALADASARRFDAASLLRRSDEALKMCTGALMLRLEDDGPADGDRALFNVDIFNPCWQWDGADLDGIASVQVRAGRIPYYFQLHRDEANRRFRTPKSAHGELEIHAGCDGELLASVPLPERPDADGFVVLDAALPAQTGTQDLCITFTGDTRPTMWVLDEVRLVPR
ncbi:family 20 glycosylhydrolase [Luteimonas sp. R10]|uniref:family 20 glycosylhydrolase n=1 Tax=Luteimonas sp. R10 TaxID=3108176 RepID=UPI00308BA43D|nr:family 20 glycosylhydrolase [Luteimonas sp. R10]